MFLKKWWKIIIFVEKKWIVFFLSFFFRKFSGKKWRKFFPQFFFLLYHQLLYCKVKNCLSILCSCINTSQYAIFKQFLPFWTLKMAKNRKFWKFLCLLSLHQKYFFWQFFDVIGLCCCNITCLEIVYHLKKLAL